MASGIESDGTDTELWVHPRLRETEEYVPNQSSNSDLEETDLVQVNDPSPLRFSLSVDETVPGPHRSVESGQNSDDALEFSGRFWDEIRAMQLPAAAVRLLEDFARHYRDLGFQRNATPDGSTAEQIVWMAAQDLGRQMRTVDVATDGHPMDQMQRFSHEFYNSDKVRRHDGFVMPDPAEFSLSKIQRPMPVLGGTLDKRLSHYFLRSVPRRFQHLFSTVSDQPTSRSWKRLFRRSHPKDPGFDPAHVHDELSQPLLDRSHIDQERHIVGAITSFLREGAREEEGKSVYDLRHIRGGGGQNGYRELLATEIANATVGMGRVADVMRGIELAMEEVSDLSDRNKQRAEQVASRVAQYLQISDVFEPVRDALQDAIVKSDLDLGIISDEQLAAVAEVMANRSLYRSVKDLVASDLMDPQWEGLHTVVPTSNGPRIASVVLGEGGMGAVYRTVIDGKQGALKVLRPHAGGGSTASPAHALRRESGVMQRIRHRNVVRVLERGMIHGGVPYFVMEYLEGLDVGKVLTNGTATLEDQIKMIWQMSCGLDATHAEDFHHRDVKPSNVILTRDGIKMTDFGLVHPGQDAQLSIEATMTKAGEIKGTPACMSPEQVDTKRYGDVSHKTDVYGLGATLYTLATGRPPFIETGRETAPYLCMQIVDATPDVAGISPPRLGALVARMLEKEQADRPELWQVRQELAAIAAESSGLSCVDPQELSDQNLAEFAVEHGVSAQVIRGVLKERDRVIAELKEMNRDGTLFFDPGEITSAEYDRMASGGVEDADIARVRELGTIMDTIPLMQHPDEREEQTPEEKHAEYLYRAKRDGISAGRIKRMARDRRADMIREMVGFGGIAASIGAPITAVAVEEYVRSQEPTVVVKVETKTKQVDAFGREVSAREARIAFRNPDIMDNNPSMSLKLSANAEGIVGDVSFRRIMIDPEPAKALAMKFGTVYNMPGAIPGYQFKGPFGEVLCIPTIGTYYRSDMGQLTRIPAGESSGGIKIPPSLTRLINALPVSDQWVVNEVGDGVKIPPRLQDHLKRTQGIDAQTPEGMQQAREHFARIGVNAGMNTLRKAVGLGGGNQAVSRPATGPVREAMKPTTPGSPFLKADTDGGLKFQLVDKNGAE